MYSKCEHCGEFAVDDSENIEVCKSCGIVVDERVFSSAGCAPISRPAYRPFNKYESKLNKFKYTSISLLHGQGVLDNLCHINNISAKGKTEIAELFKLVASVKKFNKREDGGTAAACCFYLLLRKNKQIIPINTICNQVACTKAKFSFYLKFVKSLLSTNEKFKQFSFILDNSESDNQKEKEMPDIVPSLIHEICEKAEATEKAQLMEKTASLVKLAYSCWLCTGRTPRSIVVASAYMCWKSMHPRCKNVQLKNFCRNFEINEPAAFRRIPELKALLLKLGEMIPSRTKNYVNKKNVHLHLNTILEHSETLRNDLFPNSFTCEEVETAEFTNFRHPRKKNLPRVEASDAVHYDSDMNASDIEISDTEIESYLAPDKEKIIELFEKRNLNDCNKA